MFDHILGQRTLANPCGATSAHKAGELPPPPYGGHLSEEQLRAETAALLHQNVAAMKVDNFVVRPQRKYVDKFAKADAWQKLGPEDFHELTTKVAGLPTELADEDEEAKRFDMLLLRTQLAILQAKPDFASLKEKIQTIASKLEEQSANAREAPWGSSCGNTCAGEADS